MFRLYTRTNDHIDPLDMRISAENGFAFPDTPIPWIDLVAPALPETRAVEQHMGIAIPTREEMQEIEMSARLYNENGAEFMTVTAVCGLETDEPITSPITFILKGSALVTVRYEQPRPFVAYATRAQKPGSVPCTTGEQVMFGLIEAMIDRMADALERIGLKLDSFSREIFRSRDPHGRSTRSRDFERVIEQIGREGDLLGMVRESLVSFTRLLAYHSAVEDGDKKANREARMRLKTLQRDVTALSDHSSYLAGKINFLLDSTLGLINLEQNQIIKIFSIAAVCLMPPTLVASMYGMNFKHMPELEWPYGYPTALLLMLVSAIVPIYYFRRKGWF